MKGMLLLRMYSCVHAHEHTHRPTVYRHHHHYHQCTHAVNDLCLAPATAAAGAAHSLIHIHIWFIHTHGHPLRCRRYESSSWPKSNRALPEQQKKKPPRTGMRARGWLTATNYKTKFSLYLSLSFAHTFFLSLRLLLFGPMPHSC